MASNIDPAGLRALTKLVNDSVETIISEYEKKNSTVPSLDELRAGPFDSIEETTATLSEAVKILEGACAQLSCTCASPGYTIVNRALGLYEPAAMGVALNAKIADHLGESTDGVPVSELAKKSGVDQDKLSRILRFLATTHIFREVKQDTFANSRLSAKLRTSDPTSSLLLHITDEAFTASAKFSETFGDPESTSAMSPDKSSFHRAFGMTFFEHLASPEGQFRGERFNHAMYGWGQVTGASGLLGKAYPWFQAPANARICDVGGGNGHIMLGLLKAHNHLHAIIQDLPPVLEEGKKFWNTEFAEAVTSKMVEFVPIDFLKESPVRGCAFYYMRNVLHDWADPACIKILTGIRNVMDPTSKLLIQEFAIPYLVRSSVSLTKQAPEPLLPNYGLGRFIPYCADMHMLNNLNAKERTLAEFEILFSKVNLKVNKVYDVGEFSLLEIESCFGLECNNGNSLHSRM